MSLLHAINQITTLEELSLRLDKRGGHSPPVRGVDGPVMQLHLPRLCLLAVYIEVGRMDVSSCLLLLSCAYNRPPLPAKEVVFPGGMVELLEWLRDWVGSAHPGPYASCSQDGIPFAREGNWLYGRGDVDMWVFRSQNAISRWYWGPAE